MSDGNSNVPGGDGQSAGGADGKNQKPDVVARDEYDRLMDQKKAKDRIAKEQADELAIFRAEKARREEEDAKKAGDFAKLEEGWKTRLTSVETENKTLKEEKIFSKKVSAFSRALEGKVPTKYLDLVNFEKIETDETGAPIAASVSKLADDFKKEFPEIFKVSGGVPETNPQGTGTGKLTVAEWKALPLKDRKARLHEVE